tara:strand:- start:2497 stop:3102 length:606 start_codon:yes stop_codon:yes gene_type:complete
MVITHHGGQCFKVSFGDTTLLFDPPHKDSKLSPVRFGADITLVSKQHPDFNGAKDDSFVVNGPGAYEKNGVAIRGYLTKSEHGGPEGLNTMYVVELEGMTLVFLGALSDDNIPADAREALDEVDILFVPIGGAGVLDADKAHKLAVKLEASVIIPMHYEGMGDKDALKVFTKEGAEKPTDKLTIKKKDLTDKKGDIIVLSV